MLKEDPTFDVWYTCVRALYFTVSFHQFLRRGISYPKDSVLGSALQPHFIFRNLPVLTAHPATISLPGAWKLWTLLFWEELKRLSRKHTNDYHGGSKNTHEMGAQRIVCTSDFFTFVLLVNRQGYPWAFISDKKHLNIQCWVALLLGCYVFIHYFKTRKSPFNFPFVDLKWLTDCCCFLYKLRKQKNITETKTPLFSLSDTTNQ